MSDNGIWKPLLEFPWDYPDHFTVAAVDDEFGEVTAFVCKHGGHGWLYPAQHGPQDKRTGFPFHLEEDGWRPYAWCEAPPFPPMGDVVTKPSGPFADPLPGNTPETR